VEWKRGHTYALDIAARQVQCVGVTLSPYDGISHLETVFAML